MIGRARAFVHVPARRTLDNRKGISRLDSPTTYMIQGCSISSSIPSLQSLLQGFLWRLTLEKSLILLKGMLDWGRVRDD
jgi:hypothetical protein